MSDKVKDAIDYPVERQGVVDKIREGIDRGKEEARRRAREGMKKRPRLQIPTAVWVLLGLYLVTRD